MFDTLTTDSSRYKKIVAPQNMIMATAINMRNLLVTAISFTRPPPKTHLHALLPPIHHRIHLQTTHPRHPALPAFDGLGYVFGDHAAALQKYLFL